jgi:hypothetical protein
MNDIERCSKCILPRLSNGITFDEDDCCEICNNDSLGGISNLNKNENLEKHINKIREIGKNRDYDCLVGLSGGRDSSYLLNLLVNKHHLRCIAAYYKTPFTPAIVDKNVKMLTKKLNVPLIEMDISREKHKKLAQRMMLLWIKKPNNVIANLACASCKQVNREIYKIAQRENIGYIVYGGNKLETFQFGVAQSKSSKIGELAEVSSLDRIKQTFRVAKHGIITLLKEPKLFLDFPTLFNASILYLNPHTPYLRMRYSHIKMMEYYYIAGYDEKAVIKFLSDVGWEMPENCNSTWRADCSFNEIKNYIFKQEKGVTYTDAYLSNMIRVGVLTREEALKRVEVEGQISPDRLKEVCDILNIPVNKFSLDNRKKSLKTVKSV